MFGRRDVARLRDCYNGLRRILLFLSRHSGGAFSTVPHQPKPRHIG
jgi:hypothetical protein